MQNSTKYQNQELKITKIIGGVLTCGVSFGTSALITAELLESDLKNKKFYLLDAFAGVKSSSEKENTYNYNTDLNLVKSRWNTEIPAIWICDFLTINSISNLPQLVFIHLNTGDYLSELRTLPILCSKLIKGGYLLMDLYGWQTLEKQLEIDKTLVELGLVSFQLVTRQLVIYKP